MPYFTRFSFFYQTLNIHFSRFNCLLLLCCTLNQIKTNMLQIDYLVFVLKNVCIFCFNFFVKLISKNKNLYYQIQTNCFKNGE